MLSNPMVDNDRFVPKFYTFWIIIPPLMEEVIVKQTISMKMAGEHVTIVERECVEKRNLGAFAIGAPSLDESQASPIGASSLAPALIDCVQLNDLGSSTELFAGGELLADPRSAMSPNDDMQNPDKAVIERSLEIPQLRKSDLIFLFQKKLTPTDCDPKAGRFLVPKFYAEKFLPMVPGQPSVPITIKDIKGRPWDLMLRWWQNKNSRKKLPDNELIVDLIRLHAGVTVAASGAPATRN
ncbi:hypothetical protein Cgig2_026227 [Carnegiea gigantea]|uniref:Uncharacterized protein n=1 Tax=Carnegiea gigantea TaxID=171969 RepID=A0A9Q1KI99_9CARY|nr:hypothetical protein Cgig2_026227 [Carnegiea gigantea]